MTLRHFGEGGGGAIKKRKWNKGTEGKGRAGKGNKTYQELHLHLSKAVIDP